ncbi:MAG: carbohydrate-binding protein [Chitinivibrionales bacterium]|nr:carbohydrate-binding protein [Chitinivibrionales bacterium]
MIRLLNKFFLYSFIRLRGGVMNPVKSLVIVVASLSFIVSAQHNGLDTIQAEAADTLVGVIGPPAYPTKVTSFIDSNYAKYTGVDFGTESVNSITANAVCVDNYCGKDLVFIIDTFDSTGIIGKLRVTDNMSEFKLFSGMLDTAITGVHDLYITNYNTGGGGIAIDWFMFGANNIDAQTTIQAESFTEKSEGATVYPETILNNMKEGNWAKYSFVDLGTTAPESVSVFAAGYYGGSFAATSQDLFVYAGSHDSTVGTQIAKVTIGSGEYQVYSAALDTPLTGVHDLYLVAYVSNGVNILVDWFTFASPSSIVDTRHDIVSQKTMIPYAIIQNTSSLIIDPNLAGEYTVSLVRPNGSVVMKEHFTGKSQIPLGNLADGAYTLILQTENRTHRRNIVIGR